MGPDENYNGCRSVGVVTGAVADFMNINESGTILGLKISRTAIPGSVANRNTNNNKKYS